MTTETTCNHFIIADLALVRSTLESKIKDDRYHPQYILWMAFAHQLLESVIAGAELRQLVEECIPWLEYSFLPTHSGPCTPETPCDMNCVNNTALGNLLGRVRRLTRLAAAPTEAGQ